VFGLTFEKLLLVGVVAVLLIGPERLPHYSSLFAKFVRNIRDMANGAKERLKEEMGDDYDPDEWKKLDPRQYDPRRIIREALLEDAPTNNTGPAAAAPLPAVSAPAARAPRDKDAATPFDLEST
jgi:sec-independent protein translocase protein TatB